MRQFRQWMGVLVTVLLGIGLSLAFGLVGAQAGSGGAGKLLLEVGAGIVGALMVAVLLVMHRPENELRLLFLILPVSYLPDIFLHVSFFHLVPDAILVVLIGHLYLDNFPHNLRKLFEPRSALDVVIWLFILYATLEVFHPLTLSLTFGLRGLRLWIEGCLFYFVVRDLASRREIVIWTRILVVMAALASLDGIRQAVLGLTATEYSWIAVEDRSQIGRAFSFFQAPDEFSMYEALALLVLGIVLWHYAQKGWERRALIGLGLLYGIAVMVALTKIAVAGLPVAYLAWVWLRSRDDDRVALRLRAMFKVARMATVGLFVAWLIFLTSSQVVINYQQSQGLVHGAGLGQYAANLASRIGNLATAPTKDYSVSVRLAELQKDGPIWLANPLGIGLGTVIQLNGRGQQRSVVTGALGLTGVPPYARPLITSPQNMTYETILSDLGFPGLFIIVLIEIVSLRAAYLMYRRAEIDLWKRIAGFLFAYIVLFALFFFSKGSFNFLDMDGYLWAALGLLAALPRLYQADWMVPVPGQPVRVPLIADWTAGQPVA